MAADFHDFDVSISWGRKQPEWSFRSEPFKARVFRSALEAMGGQLSKHDDLETAFRHHSDELNEIAKRKLIALEGMVDDEPLPIVASDVVTR